MKTKFVNRFWAPSFFIFLTLLVTPSHADDVVFQMPKQLGNLVGNKNAQYDFDRESLTWSGIFQYEVVEKKNPFRNISNAYLYQEYRANPQAFDSAVALGWAQKGERGLRRLYGDLREKDQNDIREGIKHLIEIAKSPKPNFENYKALGKEAYAQWKRENDKWEEAIAIKLMTERYGVSLQTGDPLALLSRLGFSSYEVVDAARTSPKLAHAIDRLNADLDVPHVNDNPELMRNRNPKAYVMVGIDKIAEQLVDVRGDIAGVEKVFTEKISEINKQLATMIEKSQKQQAADEKRQIDAQTRQEIQELADTGIATVRLMSTLVGKLDPEAGRALRIGFEPTIKMAAGIVMLKISLISTTAFVGLAITVANELLDALFGGPSDTQLILQAIAEVRAELHEFRQETALRLGVIDKKINLMFLTINERFDLVEQLVRGEFQDVKSSLSRLERRASLSHGGADALEAVLRNADAQKYRIDLRRRINLCLPPGKLDLGWEDFHRCLNDFYTCAKEDAADPLFTGTALNPEVPLGRAGVDELDALDFYGAAERLFSNSSSTTWERIAALDDVARRRFQLSLSREGSRLANVMTWSLCARAYSDLAYRWPQHYQRAVRAGYTADALEARGFEVRHGLRQLLYPDAKNGSSDRGLFLILLRDYRARVEALADYLNQRKTKFESEQVKGLNLTAGVKQSVIREPNFVPAGEAKAVIVTALKAPGEEEEKQSPEKQLAAAREVKLVYPDGKVLLKNVPASMLVAHDLGLGRIKVEHEIELSPLRPERKEEFASYLDNGFPGDRPKVLLYRFHQNDYGHVKLTLKVVFATAKKSYVIGTANFIGPEKNWLKHEGKLIRYSNSKGVRIHSDNKEIPLHLGKHLAEIWEGKDGLLTQFEKQLVEQPSSHTEAEQHATDLVNEYLRSKSLELEKQLTGDIANGQLDLERHLRAITGAKRVLVDYLQLALPESIQEVSAQLGLRNLPEGRDLFLAARDNLNKAAWFAAPGNESLAVTRSALSRIESFEKQFESIPLTGPEKLPILEDTLMRLAPLK